MLIESVYIYILKTLVYFFMEGPNPRVPSAKVDDALANYIFNY